jgi:ankyrin repeat protein
VLDFCNVANIFCSAVSLTMDLIDPLFDAVIKGDESVVNHIVSLGISLTVNDEDGLTVLHW